ncbi:hypothetical protein DFJ77DRAFT_463275 [Powellomyces hirtus]|nr:hypothetical protein DFJ77DRAFT_463275 [Powellomyces hirtus]
MSAEKNMHKPTALPPLSRHASTSSTLSRSSPAPLSARSGSSLSMQSTTTLLATGGRTSPVPRARSVAEQRPVRSGGSISLQETDRRGDDHRSASAASLTPSNSTVTTRRMSKRPSVADQLQRVESKASHTTRESSQNGKSAARDVDTKRPAGFIDYTLICARNVLDRTHMSDKEILHATRILTHLRLDRAALTSMQHLDGFSNITHLYLQHNAITRIEGLEYLPALRFLILSNNHISRLEGLSECWNLRLLDVSRNVIQSVGTATLPPHLIYLLLAANPCAHLPEYRLELIQRVPDVEEIDEVAVTQQERELARTLAGRYGRADPVVH